MADVDVHGARVVLLELEALPLRAVLRPRDDDAVLAAADELIARVVVRDGEDRVPVAGPRGSGGQRPMRRCDGRGRSWRRSCRKSAKKTYSKGGRRGKHKAMRERE